MTQNKRIVLNTVATYGRSMFGVACGIFSARWVLEALGHEDFGLYAVVGAMAVFLGFLNVQFSGAIARYYAFSIGLAKSCELEEAGLIECRSWFTMGVVIHTILPLVMVAVGWPLGEYAIRHAWLEIPTQRISSCVWVWRIVCVSSFFSMFNVPFQAMYTAKQYIAELTLYSFFQTIAKTTFIFFMTLHHSEWIIKYALAMAIIAVVPQMMICVRAIAIFRECRIVRSAFYEFYRVKDLACYALWTAIGGLGYVASHQCMSILINNNFGAKVVAGFGVSQTVSGEAASLTGALQGAFAPAITTAYGAGEYERFRTMSFWACKAGTFLTLMFAIPMALEIDQILVLWLKNPPQMAAPLSICALAFVVLEKLSCGHLTAVNATGKIAKMQMLRGVLRCLVIPIALIPMCLNWDVVAVAVALPVSVIIVDFGDVWMARRMAGMSVRYWILQVVMPLGIIAVISSVFGIVVRHLLPQSFFRVVCTTFITLATMLPLAWAWLFSCEERELVMRGVGALRKRLWHSKRVL